jgi:hypothetical protein
VLFVPQSNQWIDERAGAPRGPNGANDRTKTNFSENGVYRDLHAIRSNLQYTSAYGGWGTLHFGFVTSGEGAVMEFPRKCSRGSLSPEFPDDS